MPVGQSFGGRVIALINEWSPCMQVPHLPSGLKSFSISDLGPPCCFGKVMCQCQEAMHASALYLNHSWMKPLEADRLGKEEPTFPSLVIVNQSTASQPSKVEESPVQPKRTAQLACRVMNDSK